MRITDGIAYAEGPRSPIEVESATVVGDLSMLVTFVTGETRMFDATPLLKTPAFAPLADPEVFGRFSIDHGVVCWMDGDIDLAPAQMHAMSQTRE